MAYPATPKTWVAGDVLTAAQLNAELRDALLAAFPLSVNAWTAYTPTLTQSATVTKTVGRATYQRIGRLIIGQYTLNVTGAGTAGQNVLVGLPVAAAATTMTIGMAWIFDASAAVRYVLTTEVSTTTTVTFQHDTSGGSAFGAAPAVTLASGDIISGHFAYEAAT